MKWDRTPQVKILTTPNFSVLRRPVKNYFGVPTYTLLGIFSASGGHFYNGESH